MCWGRDVAAGRAVAVIRTPDGSPKPVGCGRYRPYPVYKDSGVEWLGEIPAHWDVRRLKFVLAAPLKYGANEAAELDDPDLPRYVRITDINEGDGLRDETFKSLPVEVAREFLLQTGDLLFARSGATAGKTFLYRTSWGTCAYAGYLIRARLDTFRYSPEFIRYFTASSTYWQWLSSAFIQATIQNVSAERYANLRIPLPPLSEQCTIAVFLDRETARIDALVAKKERLIELLQEKRTALITHAVTKGLDPNVPLRDSGVEWLGEIPARWDVKPLRWAIMFQRGHDLPTDEREEGDVPVVSSSGISSSHSRAVANAPGIVTGRYGTIGHFHLIVQDYWPLNTTLYSIDLRGNDPRFLWYMLTHLSPLFLLNAVKSAVPGVDRNDLHPTKTAVPPRAEQYAIASFLDHETARIDALVAKVRTVIDLLKEHRTSLISAAVTGKIDVREDAA
jgi:type I restriction enzyme, S subunit